MTLSVPVKREHRRRLGVLDGAGEVRGVGGLGVGRRERALGLEGAAVAAPRSGAAATPRWSVVGHGATPPSSARLSGWMAIVIVGPPLSATASRPGSATVRSLRADEVARRVALQVAALGADGEAAVRAEQVAGDDRVAEDHRGARLDREVERADLAADAAGDRASCCRRSSSWSPARRRRRRRRSRRRAPGRSCR